MKKTYTGGCQCGKVRYEVLADIGDVITCNCSRCRKLGPLLSAVAMSDFKLLSGENEVTDYQFNKRAVHHPFCRTCGIESYAYGKGPGGREMVMLTVEYPPGAQEHVHRHDAYAFVYVLEGTPDAWLDGGSTG